MAFLRRHHQATASPGGSGGGAPRAPANELAGALVDAKAGGSPPCSGPELSVPEIQWAERPQHSAPSSPVMQQQQQPACADWQPRATCEGDLRGANNPGYNRASVASPARGAAAEEATADSQPGGRVGGSGRQGGGWREGGLEPPSVAGSPGRKAIDKCRLAALSRPLEPLPLHCTLQDALNILVSHQDGSKAFDPTRALGPLAPFRSAAPPHPAAGPPL